MNTTITRIRTKGQSWGRPLAMTMAQLAEETRNTRYANRVERTTRQCTLARLGKNAENLRLSKRAGCLPYVIFSSLFSSRGTEWFAGPTGLILLSIDCGDDPMRMAVIRKRAMETPSTVMVFRGCSGRTLKVVVRCLPTGNQQLPKEADQYLQFLARATRQAARYYEAVLDCRIPLPQPSLTYGCRMSHDSETYYNGKALPMTITSDDALLGRYPLAHTDEAGHYASLPQQADVERQQIDFYTCVTKAREECPATAAADDPLTAEALLVRLARNCRRSGLPEETSVRRTLLVLPTTADETLVRKVFRSVYEKLPEGKSWALLPEKERTARQVKEFLERRYELRYNTLKGIEEYRPRSIDYEPWRPLADRDIRRIAQEQLLEVGAAWPVGVEQYARSGLTPDYNPLHEFLAGCGKWNGKQDYIANMARRVPCQWPEWPLMFRRWLLAMVAAWLGRSRDYANAMVPMLIGRQGTRKSTFCKLLLPHSLREYYIDDVKLDNAEQVERMLARMALVNIDEYDAKSAREQAKIKRILTERDVQVRRMHSDQYVMMQRTASFIATTNERQPLTDTTGNRRYLCVELTGVIDTETPVNYQQLYAQALWELDHGHPYYLTKDEETALEEHNRPFVATSGLETILTSRYEPMPTGKQHFVKAIDILKDLQENTQGTDRPTMNKLVAALKAAHFTHGAQNGVRGWYARKR